MPNHVTNILTIEGHEQHIKDVLNAVRYEDPKTGEIDQFSFNAILPMPDELKGTRSPAQIVSKAEYKKMMKDIERRKQDPTPADEMFGITGPITKEMSDDLIARFGANNWYDWAIGNWGTKWGAYDVEVNDNVITFLTAWSGGHVVVQELSKQFPLVTFHLTFADEDCGHNVAKLSFKEGGVINEFIPDGGSKEAFDLYFEVCNPTHEGWELVDGEWEYVD